MSCETLSTKPFFKFFMNVWSIYTSVHWDVRDEILSALIQTQNNFLALQSEIIL